MMKKFFGNFVAAFMVLALWATPASAHVGPNPFLKVNGQYCPSYPVYSSSIENFPLPQDVALGKYVVGDTIDFEVDMSVLPPVPPELQGKVQFLWDFGDGSKGKGVKISHVFHKGASYIVNVNVDDGSGGGPQSLDSVLVQVLPNGDYQLPQALVTVNNQQITDSIGMVVYKTFTHSFTFDGSASKLGSTNIVSYFWDFGDQKSSKDVSATHSYSNKLRSVFPLLRVTDANGFFADAYAQIDNSDLGGQDSVFNQNNAGNSASVPQMGKQTASGSGKEAAVKSSQPNQLIYVLGGLGLILGVVFVAQILRKKKRGR